MRGARVNDINQSINQAVHQPLAHVPRTSASVSWPYPSFRLNNPTIKTFSTPSKSSNVCRQNSAAILKQTLRKWSTGEVCQSLREKKSQSPSVVLPHALGTVHSNQFTNHPRSGIPRDFWSGVDAALCIELYSNLFHARSESPLYVACEPTGTHVDAI
jgi:hypothetical protein